MSVGEWSWVALPGGKKYCDNTSTEVEVKGSFGNDGEKRRIGCGEAKKRKRKEREKKEETFGQRRIYIAPTYQPIDRYFVHQSHR